MPSGLARALELSMAAVRGAPLEPLASGDVGLGGERAALVWLFILLAIAFVGRLGVALILPSVYFPDEVFQYWEQGYRLVFGYGMVPWEYRDGVRNWLLPGAIGGVIAMVNALGGGPAVWRAAVQALLSLASLGIVITSFLWARRLSGSGAGLLAAFISTFWFEFVYFSPRPLTEILAAATLFPAAYLLCAVPDPTRRARFAGGALLGLSFVLRLHLAPAVALVGVAALVHLGPRRMLLPTLAALFVVVVAGLIDWATWGLPFFSFWQNFVINVIEDKSSSFGTLPVYWYLMYYANAWPGLVAVMLGLLAVGMRRSPLLLAVPLLILVSHSVIAHKEYRFLYPGLPFLLTLASIGAAELFAAATRPLDARHRRWAFAALAFGWLITSASLAGQEGFRPYFFKQADKMALYAEVRDAPSACGFGISGTHWADTPGYVGLNRNIPLYFVDEKQAAELSTAFDFYMFHRWKIGRDWSVPDPPAGFDLKDCVGEFCLAERAGFCVPQPDKDVHSAMAKLQ